MKCAKRVGIILGVGVAGWVLVSLIVQVFLMSATIANDSFENNGRQ